MELLILNEILNACTFGNDDIVQEWRKGYIYLIFKKGNKNTVNFIGIL